jgi:hypothetical protein
MAEGELDADTVKGVLHLQQGSTAAAWDLPVKVAPLLILFVDGQLLPLWTARSGA